MANTDSQYRIEQVVADSKPLGSASDGGADTTTVTTTTTTDTAAPTDTNNGGKDNNGADTPTTDKPTGDKPTIIVVSGDNPLFQSKENDKGMLNPSAVMYYGVMSAILIALLAFAYNSVKTAK